jgi:Raf kinase inhibitor-like YbhB/YbcL family protein
MKRQLIILGAVVVAALLTVWFVKHRQSAVQTDSAFINSVSHMKIESPAFAQGGEIPSQYTCDGPDVSPPLAITGAPEGTKSLALLVDDPDAVVGTWVHWLVWNIDPSVALTDEGAVPRGGIEGVTSSGRPGWHGPCPPSGTHRYFFKIFALDVTLDLPASAGASEFERAINGHVLDKAGLLGNYRKK